MTVASIDIGTNTVLLLVARIDASGRISTLAHEQRVPRLGKGVDALGNISPDATARVIAVLQEYRRMIGPYRPDAVVVCGTSAVRDAQNRDAFAARVLAETGFIVEALSGRDEALWSYRGAISGLPDVAGATVLDIGGGSTEIAAGDRTSIRTRVSLDIGAVRLTERFFRHDPPTEAEIGNAEETVRAALAGAGAAGIGDSVLVGVAGTATSLAILDRGLEVFDIHALINYSLRLENIRALFGVLRSKSAAEIRRLSAVMEGRADVITAGTLILQETMQHLGFPAMIVSERGVRYGLALRAWEAHPHT